MIRVLQILFFTVFCLSWLCVFSTTAQAGEVKVTVDCVKKTVDHPEVHIYLEDQDSILWVAKYDLKITELKPTKPYTDQTKAPHPFYRRLVFGPAKRISSGPPDEAAVGKFPDGWQEYKPNIICIVGGREVPIDPHISIHR